MFEIDAYILYHRTWVKIVVELLPNSRVGQRTEMKPLSSELNPSFTPNVADGGGRDGVIYSMYSDRSLVVALLDLGKPGP